MKLPSSEGVPWSPVMRAVRAPAVILLSLFAARVATAEVAWVPLESKELGFRALFPGRPSPTSHGGNGGAGARGWHLSPDDQTEYEIDVTEFPAEAAAHWLPGKVLQGGQDGALLNVNGKVRTEGAVFLSDPGSDRPRCPGREFTADLPTGALLHMRLYLCGPKFITILRVNLPANDSASDWKRFADSFALLESEAPADGGGSSLRWTELVRPEEGFRISFPGNPSLLTGDAEMDDHRLWTKSWSLSLDAQTSYRLVLTHFPEERANSWDPEQVLRSQTLAALDAGSSIREQHAVTLPDGPGGEGRDPGLEFVADRRGGGIMNGRLYVVGSYVIQIVRGGPQTASSTAEWKKFVESFAILDDDSADDENDASSEPPTWEPIGNGREGFLALFPGEPAVEEGDIDTTFRTAHVKTWSIDLENAGYFVKVITFSPEAAQAWKPAQLLKEWQHGFVDKDEKLLAEKTATLPDPAHPGATFPGRDCLVAVRNNEFSHLRLYLVGARLFEVSRTGPKTETSEAEWRKFVDAFQVPAPSQAPPLVWSTMVGREDRFRISFPGEPSVSEADQETPLRTAHLKVWELVVNDGHYGVLVARFSKDAIAAVDPGRLLKDWQEGVLKDRARIEHEEEVSLHDRVDPSLLHPGRDVSAEVKDGTFVHLRLWLVGSRMIQLSRIGPPTAETDAEWERFADSFALLGREQPPGAWTDLVRADKAFQISFPGEATEKPGSEDDEDDDAPSASWSCEQDDGTEYLVAIFPASTEEADLKDPGKYLETEAAKSVSNLGKIRSGEEIWIKGPGKGAARYRGREFIADLDGGNVAFSRLYLVDTQLFLIIRVGAETPAGRRDWRKFVDSFRVLPQPGLPSDVHPPQGI